MGIHHRGFKAFVPQQLLDFPDISTIHQKMGCKTMPESVWCRMLDPPDDSLKCFIINMKSPYPIVRRINSHLVGGKKILPAEFFFQFRHLYVQEHGEAALHQNRLKDHVHEVFELFQFVL